MKTIAVTIDEKTLTALDKFAKRSEQRGSSRGTRRNRSELVRMALHQFLARQAQSEQAAQEWLIWSRHLKRINIQGATLIDEQAQP